MEQINVILKDKYMPKTDKLVVFGNPPFQMQSDIQKGREGVGKIQAKPIYNIFIEAIIDHLNPRYFSFIVPSRWMVGGMGLDSFRERMMSDRRIKQIAHFPGENDIFPTVSIAGGVNYFLWDRGYNGVCTFEVAGTSIERYLNEYDIILQDNNALPILTKILSKNNSSIVKEVSSINPFGVKGNFSNWVLDGIKCYAQYKEIKYINENDISNKNGYINKWKVCVAHIRNEGASFTGTKWKLLKTPFIVEPNAVCVDTYIVIKTFDCKEEADNFITYRNTQFFRFILSLRVVSQHISKDCYTWVPDVGPYYTPITDEKLYKIFNITRQQQQYIESKIKEIKE